MSNEEEELGYDGYRGESFAWDNKEKCDKETGECKLTEYDYGTDRADFIWFGVMSWFRSFDLFNILTFMPTAVTYTRLIRQNKEAAPKFLWMVRLWSHIGGWVTSLANMGLAAKLIANYADDVKNEDCTTKRGRRGRRRFTVCDEVGKSSLNWGVTILAYELIGWACYYAWRKGAYRFAEHLNETHADF